MTDYAIHKAERGSRVSRRTWKFAQVVLVIVLSVPAILVMNRIDQLTMANHGPYGESFPATFVTLLAYMIYWAGAFAVAKSLLTALIGPLPEPKADQRTVMIATLRALDTPWDTSEGWKADPLNPEQLRWWDGTEWKPKIGIRKTAAKA